MEYGITTGYVDPNKLTNSKLAFSLDPFHQDSSKIWEWIDS